MSLKNAQVGLSNVAKNSNIWRIEHEMELYMKYLGLAVLWHVFRLKYVNFVQKYKNVPMLFAINCLKETNSD